MKKPALTSTFYLGHPQWERRKIPGGFKVSERRFKGVEERSPGPVTGLQLSTIKGSIALPDIRANSTMRSNMNYSNMLGPNNQKRRDRFKENIKVYSPGLIADNLLTHSPSKIYFSPEAHRRINKPKIRREDSTYTFQRDDRKVLSLKYCRNGKPSPDAYQKDQTANQCPNKDKGTGFTKAQRFPAFRVQKKMNFMATHMENW